MQEEENFGVPRAICGWRNGRAAAAVNYGILERHLTKHVEFRLSFPKAYSVIYNSNTVVRGNVRQNNF
jgi:hypothetical protein